MLENEFNLMAISPIDGRYSNTTKVLNPYFSEYALIKYRVMIEIKWLEKMFDKNGFIDIVDKLSDKEISSLENIYTNFSLDDASRVKEIETITKHDVKAVEYFIREKTEANGLNRISSFIHFACTSEDINNLAYSLMIKDGLDKAWKPLATELINKVNSLAKEWINIPMLAHTHGQPASPTTVGKELLVFVKRWERILKILDSVKLVGKFNGATGNFNSHIVSYPNVNWIEISKEFIQSLDLEPNMYTTQIESHDIVSVIFNTIKSFNNITMDFNSDMWLYISMNYFKQKSLKGEVGSSVMPHKINPINHENSMANIRMSNSILGALADNLPISRMQRDLSDSSMLRNIGTGLAYSIISISQSILGFEKMLINEEKMLEDLNNNPEVLAEAIQTVLRKNGFVDAYEILKEMTRGKAVTLENIQEFINSLEIPEQDKNELLKLSPSNYIGLADKLYDIT